MTTAKRLRDLIIRYGAPVKFATKQVLNFLIPGTPYIVDLVCSALECVDESVSDQLDLENLTVPVDKKDLEQLEKVVDVLCNDLQPLLAQVAKLEQIPDVADKIIETALETDDRYLQGLQKLDALIANFDQVSQQQEQIIREVGFGNELIEEMLPLVRRISVIAEFVEELRSNDVHGEDFGKMLKIYTDGEKALRNREFIEAQKQFSKIKTELPKSLTTLLALATVQSLNQDWHSAQQNVAKAVELAPDDQDLRKFHSRTTQMTQRVETPSGSVKDFSISHLKVGAILDNWKIEKLLGAGGWGQVFEASKGKERVAIKVMHSHLSQEPNFVLRFRREIMSLSRMVRHRNIVTIKDFGKCEEWGCWYFVMELIQGLSLEQYLKKRGKLTTQEAVQLFMQIAGGVGSAHANGVVHRDIKPANILIRGDDSPVLVDFGIASVEDQTGLTITGHSAGFTPDFAAPEQLNGGTTDARSDIYSLAATLKFCLQYEDPEKSVLKDIHPVLTQILKKSLSHDKEDRYQNGLIFSDALSEINWDGVDSNTETVTLTVIDTNIWCKVNSWMIQQNCEGHLLHIEFHKDAGKPAVTFGPFSNAGISQGGMRVVENNETWNKFSKDTRGKNPRTYEVKYWYEKLPAPNQTPLHETFLNTIPGEMTKLYQSFFASWSKVGNLKYGKKGISMKMVIAGKERTLIDTYHDIGIKILRRKDSNDLCLGSKDYSEYSTRISELPVARNLLLSDKCYVSHDKINAEELKVILDATMALAESVARKDN